MAKYPMRYFSVSKGAHVEIETMPSPHIANALRKLITSADCDLALADCMTQELRARGCTLGEDGKWAFPAKEVVP